MIIFKFHMGFFHLIMDFQSFKKNKSCEFIIKNKVFHKKRIKIVKKINCNSISFLLYYC